MQNLFALKFGSDVRHQICNFVFSQFVFKFRHSLTAVRNSAAVIVVRVRCHARVLETRHFKGKVLDLNDAARAGFAVTASAALPVNFARRNHRL